MVQRALTAKCAIGRVFSSRDTTPTISFPAAVREDPQLQFEQVQLETTEGMSEQAALRQLSAQCQGQSEGMSEQEAV
jgi:hypothetical protein